MSPEPDFPSSPAPADFPEAHWGHTHATFLPVGADVPEDAPVTAVLVFALSAGRFVVADIAGRGWCIPSGRQEPGETPEETVRREAREEAGATLGPLRLLGHFVLKDLESQITQKVPAYVAEVLSLDALPSETESQGVCLMTLEELPERYFRWDAMLESVFRWVGGRDERQTTSDQ